MATVTPAATASFQLGPFDTLTLSSGGARGSIALTSLAPKICADQTLTPQNGTFGPWGVPMSVVMTITQGACDYTVNQAPVSGGTATTAAALMALKRAGTLTSGSTYVTPEGYTYKANSATNFRPIDKTTPIVTGVTATLMGDSFNAGAVYTARQSTLSIPAWMGLNLPQPLEVVAYRAVAGQSWATINSGQLAAALADASDVAFITCGPNVWLPVATSTTVDQAIIDATPVLDALSAAKQLVIVCNSSPGVAASYTRMADKQTYNARIAALCAKYPNVILADIDSAMIDTTSATGDVLTAATYDSLLHPNMRGAMRCGRAAAQAVAARTIIVGRTATDVAGAPDFSTTGGTKTAGTGTITGSIPTGMRAWISSGSMAATLTNINTSGSAGYQLGVALTNAAGTASRIDIDLGGTSTAFNAGLVAGDVIRGWVDIRFKSFTKLAAFYATMQVTGGGGTTQFAFTPHTGADATPTVETPYSGRIYFPPQTLGAGFTSLNMTIAVQLQADATAAASFDVSGYHVEKVGAV